MASRERPRDSRVRTSRRAFLLTAGSAAGVGLTATAAGQSRSSATGSAAIAVSPAQRAAVRDALDRSSSLSPDGVSLRVAETAAGLERLAAGDVDAVVGSRPALPSERERAADRDVAYDRLELPAATAALERPAATWVDCLRPTSVAETWAGEGAVETWAEVPSDSTADGAATTALSDAAAVDSATAGGASDEVTAGDQRGVESRPSREAAVLVRGVRSHQYASGHGGLGYYEPHGDWIEGPLDASERGDDSHARLVRLGFLSVASESSPTVDDFVRAYERRSAELLGDVRYFGSPFRTV